MSTSSNIFIQENTLNAFIQFYKNNLKNLTKLKPNMKKKIRKWILKTMKNNNQFIKI